jgi:hypothetical protein
VLGLEAVVMVFLRQSGVRRRVEETSRARREELRAELEGQVAAEVVAFPDHIRASERSRPRSP